MAVAVSPVRAEVEHQRSYDQHREGRQGMLLARMGAVLGAQQALAQGELGAAEALRHGLIDLAAISELLAGDIA